MISRDRSSTALQPLMAVIIAAVFLLTMVVSRAVLPATIQLTAPEVEMPASSPACIVVRQHVGADRAGATGRTAFASASRGCTMAMHTDMMQAFDAQRSADVIFAAAMIPHHQGGVDMARQLLLYGSDPELRALALGVIAEQQAEIEMLRVWIARQHDIDSAP